MQVVHERCAGVDVHKRTVVVTVLVSPAAGTPEKAVEKYTRTFGTMTADLLALSEWLDQLGVTQVAMESTGVYWRQVFNVLEPDHAVLLVNPQHMHVTPTESG